jgi:hypothetical protein
MALAIGTGNLWTVCDIPVSIALDDCREFIVHVTLSRVVYPRIYSTDLDDLICKTYLALGALGLAAQRMISVAWKRTVGGIVIPRASAVLRLMTSSYLVGCSTGKSAGLAPLRILST